MSGVPLDLVITNGQIQLQKCTLYAHVCGMVDSHHVIPESWWVKAGLPVSSPLEILCPNCHYNTHVAIDGILAGHDVSLLPKRCVQMAQAGIDGAKAAGLTPERTL